MSQEKPARLPLEHYKNILISHLEKNRIFNRFFNAPLWKGVLILGVGSIFVQALNVITLPIITRLYTPADFGLLGLFSAVLTVVMTFISLRYEFAIPVPKDSETAAHLLVLCIGLICLSSLALFVVFIVFGDFFITTFNLQTIAPFLWLLILGCMGAGLYQALNYWAIRKKDYTTITFTQFNQSISGNSCKILFGFIGIGALGLLFGQVISSIAGVGSFIRGIRLADRNSFSSISFSGIKRAARKYRDFPVFSMPSTLIFQLSMQLPIFFISSLYSIREVGWYSLTYQMLMFPSYFISNSVGQAFYGEAATEMHKNPSSLKKLFLNTVKKLTLISLPVIGGIAIIAPFVIPIIFGASWVGAGIFAIPMAFVAISQFIMTPTNKLAVYGFNNWQFGYHIFRIILIVTGFYISYLLHFDALLSLFVYGIIIAFTYIVLFYLNILAINRLIANYPKHH